VRSMVMHWFLKVNKASINTLFWGMVRIMVSALCLVAHCSMRHMITHWGDCNRLEHRMEFIKNCVFYTNGRCIIQNSTGAFYVHAAVP
jgi:hypothetical protein